MAIKHNNALKQGREKASSPLAQTLADHMKEKIT